MQLERRPRDIEVKVNEASGWVKDGGAYARGTAFFRGQKMGSSELARQLQQYSTRQELDHFVKELNGFFALIRKLSSEIIAYVDRVRSIPLFYGNRAGVILVADDPEWVRERVGDDQYDPVAEREFQLAGYVTGSDTLYPNVKQLLAGQRLLVSCQSEPAPVRTESYYRFWHTEPQSGSEDELYGELDYALQAATKRLLSFADGRQIVLPLSGGYDSRLVALSLRQSGYKNVLTYSYGLPDNWEAARSRQVANALGFEWAFVEYSKPQWRKWSQSDDFRRYLQMASGAASLPHTQDWPAVMLLRDAGRVSRDAVFVPGHSGDFISSSHLPDALRTPRSVDQDQLVKHILDVFYYLVRSRRIERELRQYFALRILERIDIPQSMSAQTASNLYEMWGWRELQAKFILNSLRVYEYWGYDWWCPLWDLDVMLFWQRVPLAIRTAGFYRSFVNDQWTRTVGELPAPEADHPLRIVRQRFGFIADRLKQTRLVATALRIGSFYKHPLAISGQWQPTKALVMLCRGYSSNGVAAERYLSLERNRRP